MNPCPPSERWQAHLEGTLDPAEQAALTEHLGGCPSCQHTLQTLACEGDSLLDVARQVGADADPPDATQGATPKSQGDATEAERTPAEAAEVLSFLAPPQRKGSLGRLDHYEVLEVLGKGGFGTVVKAFDEKLHRVVAIKILAPELAANGAAKKRFDREAKSAAAVKHDNVVAIYAVEAKAVPYLVMEYIEGQTLQGKLDKGGPLEVKEILRIGYQIAAGLASAHKQGLIHRDIKPGNILLENGVERVKITDFGLARATDDVNVTQSGVIAGTPAYMSPEQAEGLALDQRSDLFSLGTVLYVMCTGRPPFRASGTMGVLKRVCEDTPRPIREINPEIPPWLCDVIEKLHAKKPDERYQTAKEVGDVLANYLSDIQLHGRVSAVSHPGAEPSASTPPAPPSLPTAARPRNKGRRLVYLWILLVLSLAYLIMWFVPNWFLLLTNQGVLEFELAAPVRVGTIFLQREGDQMPIQIDLPSRPLRLAPGQYHVDDVKLFDLPVGQAIWSRDQVTLGRGDRRSIRIEWKPGLAKIDAAAVDREPAWVQLFNGQDLTGWHKHPSQPGNWRVEEGALTGSGPGAHSHLFSDRDDYENLHLRALVRVNFRNQDQVVFGNSGIFFRSSKKLDLDAYHRYPSGYEAQIFAGENAPSGAKERNRTGSLYGLKPYEKVLQGADAGDWFTLEIIARGPRITIKVNGVTTVDEFEDTKYQRGHLALQQAGAGTIVQFKKIEIKELPPTALLLAIAPFDVAKAKDHQDAWAKHLGVPVEITNKIGMKLRLVPPGKNELGPSGSGESAEPLYMGTTEVTVEQFRRFADDAKYQTRGEINKLGGMRVQAGKMTERDPAAIWSHPDFARGDDYPVTLVTWHDAMAFCAWLSRDEGRTYRLPSIAEWRWAERAGSGTRFYFDDTSPNIDAHAWHVGNAAFHSHPVAGKERNPWGLFDVYGNAWELSYDWQRSGKLVDPSLRQAGPSQTDRILFLGGGFANPAEGGMDANGPSNVGYSHLGFRVAVVGDLKAKTPP